MAGKSKGPETQTGSIKKPDTYDALRREGASKSKAAAIANAQAAGENPSAKGGRAKPYEDWTKAALYDRARDLDVPGRSRMDKQALIVALRTG